ncbi:MULTISPECIES: hypothetical protein [Pseudoalteromonas]|uniref:hypothetical protein n=1 Tax=Pseudoalteromonas TaxID=53246 RepID=UPI000F793FB8|nr:MULTISPECIES: hypothetical protein [Pseudoalteromonas]MCG7562747.1 hypothetical protein [Pseudoalteromonas sp. McH1-42]
MTKYDSFMKYQVIKDDNWEKNRAKQIQSYNTEKTQVSPGYQLALTNKWVKSLFSQVCFVALRAHKVKQTL